MKKMFLLIVLFAFSQTAFAQASKVPDAVKTAFAKAYPNADDVKWELENGHYEVEFEMTDDHEMSVLYDAAGALLETEVEIPFSDLPKAAQEALKGKKVKETAKITNAKGVVTYEAEVRRKDLMFDAQGNPVK
ncbi:MAG: PepSY-like domain-containing protein [Phycisphaerae bacterium]|nr:PepSY-like domain-containing protein [Saprospiraceae bacterium]